MTTDNELDAAIATLPRRLPPPPAVWEGVQAGIAARRRRRWWASAAALGLAAGACAWWAAVPAAAPERAMGGLFAGIEPAATSAPSPAAAASPEPARELIPAESELRAATDDLARAFRQRRPLLDDALLAAFDTNLGVVDDAIATSRAALAERPTDPHLRSVLDRAYRHKLALLRAAAVTGEGP